MRAVAPLEQLLRRCAAEVAEAEASAEVASAHGAADLAAEVAEAADATVAALRSHKGPWVQAAAARVQACVDEAAAAQQAAVLRLLVAARETRGAAAGYSKVRDRMLRLRRRLLLGESGATTACDGGATAEDGARSGGEHGSGASGHNEAARRGVNGRLHARAAAAAPVGASSAAGGNGGVDVPQSVVAPPPRLRPQPAGPLLALPLPRAVVWVSDIAGLERACAALRRGALFGIDTEWADGGYDGEAGGVRIATVQLAGGAASLGGGDGGTSEGDEGEGGEALESFVLEALPEHAPEGEAYMARLVELLRELLLDEGGARPVGFAFGADARLLAKLLLRGGPAGGDDGTVGAGSGGEVRATGGCSPAFDVDSGDDECGGNDGADANSVDDGGDDDDDADSVDGSGDDLWPTELLLGEEAEVGAAEALVRGEGAAVAGGAPPESAAAIETALRRRAIDVQELAIWHGIGSRSRAPSLQAAVERVVGHTLDKSEQRSSWQDRPLREAQTRYAALDAVSALRILVEMLTHHPPPQAPPAATAVASLAAAAAVQCDALDRLLGAAAYAQAPLSKPRSGLN